jgi:hypothetical protein
MLDNQHDANDGTPWSAMDIEDLKNSVLRGRSAEWVAHFLCRRGTVEGVLKKAAELGLQFKTKA